jgi:hypothetical protein
VPHAAWPVTNTALTNVLIEMLLVNRYALCTVLRMHTTFGCVISS